MIDPAVALIGLRALIFATAAILFGSSLLFALYWNELAATLRARLAPVFKAAALTLAISTPLMLFALASLAGEGWADALNGPLIMSLALNTRGGQAMLVRITLAAVIVWVTWFSAERRWQAALWPGLYVASFAITGHAIMHEGLKGVAHQINHALHVLAGSFWIGALIPLLLAAHMPAKGSQTLRSEALALLTRFSSAGAIAVSLIAVTGALNTFLILGKVPDDLSSAYQALLLTKIAVISVMLVLALANRLWLVPSAKDHRLHGALAFSIAAECLAGLTVIALVAAFGTMEPV